MENDFKDDTTNGWRAYKIYVVKHLEALTEDNTDIKKSLAEIKTEMAIMKTKMTMYSGGISFVVAILSQIFIYLLVHSPIIHTAANLIINKDFAMVVTSILSNGQF
jgi:hypothetical protein